MSVAEPVGPDVGDEPPVAAPDEDVGEGVLEQGGTIGARRRILDDCVTVDDGDIVAHERDPVDRGPMRRARSLTPKEATERGANGLLPDRPLCTGFTMTASGARQSIKASRSPAPQARS